MLHTLKGYRFALAALVIVTVCAALAYWLHPAFGMMPFVLGITFNSIPTALREPFVAVEFDNSRASQGSAALLYRTLLLGQKRSTGTATADTAVRVSSAAEVAVLAGRGSMLHRMALAFFANNRQAEAYIGVVADDAGGTAASGTLTVTGPATATGTLSLYLGGERVSVAVAAGDIANTVAASINAAINALGDLAVSSSVSTNVVTVTHRHKGTVGNQFDMRLNYQDGEATPAGVAVAIVQLASGATDPSLTALIAALGDSWFQIIAHPYTGATNLGVIEAEMADRFGPTRMIDGLAVTAKNDTLGNMSTLGNGRNSPHSSILDVNASPTPAPEYAAAAAAVIAKAAQADSGRPFQTLPLTRVLPPTESARRTLEERNTLLFDGISTTKVVGSTVQLSRVITTYQTSASLSPDDSYLDATTVLTLMYLRFSFRAWIASRYQRAKLANDGVRIGAGQVVMTPSVGKAEAVAWFRAMEELGLVENMDAFKDSLVVERNVSDANRLDFLLPPDLINQLIVVGAQIQFRV